ncbi:MAG: hypothetical protein JOZ71_03000 [Ktedonobacteraceae bacterium]|nr:hypothetical protein [Ktedonobacteraceae bacterium]
MADKTFWQAGSPITVIEHVDEAVVADAVMVSLLQRHGCVIRASSILFPAGTLAQEILPRWGWTEKYTILLPDGLELGWKRDRSRQPARSLLQVSRQLYEQERHTISFGQRTVNEQGILMTIQATLQEVVALGVALHSYKLQLEHQPSVLPEQQEVLDLVLLLHDRFVASLPSSTN